MSTPAGVILPIALGDNWIYALPSDDGILLIDAGPDYAGAWEELTAQLDVAGFSPHDVRAVVVTHGHLDHCGLAARWQSIGATVCGSASELERFALGEAAYSHHAGLVRRFMRACGVPGERLTPPQTRGRPRRDARRWRSPLRGTPFTPQRRLVQGDEVSAGERVVHFIPTPGHTPGDAVYFETAAGALFSGDHLLPDTTPSPGMHFPSGTDGERMRSLPAYTRSLERVRALGARTLYPGHGAPSEVATVIERTVQRQERRRRLILPLLQDEPLTPYAVLTRSFPHLPDAWLRQGMAEIVGHLDVLVERGDVVVEQSTEGGISVRVPTTRAPPTSL